MNGGPGAGATLVALSGLDRRDRAVFFWDAVSLRRALFYFDITEINYPYRAFFAEELKAGRFSRWCPGLYCGLPLFSESQAGYLHPFKYLLYPWLQTWQAFNLDTVLSVWLTGVGTYCWLRRHVGPAVALTGAAIFGASGYVWGHLIHTSMINALASVPFVIWGLESSWSTGRWRGVVLGGVALACQVFAGHLQDSLLTIGLVGLYGIYRAATETRPGGPPARTRRWRSALVGLGVLISGVQWVPSKELLDRSPRAGGLSWDELTYGSWRPELLPTVVVREAYGTRARDTDWMDGYYPYHEMNTYMGLIAIVLAVVGARGPAARDRWVELLGLADRDRLVADAGQVHFLVRLCAPDADSGQLARAGAVSRVGFAGAWPRWRRPASNGWGGPASYRFVPGSIVAGVLGGRLDSDHDLHLCSGLDPSDDLDQSSITSTATAGWAASSGSPACAPALLAVCGVVDRGHAAARLADPVRRARWAAILPLLVLADLLSAHWVDVPTVDPAYWTVPPETARRLKANPNTIRIFGVCDKASGEPGYASEELDFMPVRDPLAWSLRAGLAPQFVERAHADDFAPARRFRRNRRPAGFVMTSRATRISSRARVPMPRFAALPKLQVGAAYVYRNTRRLAARAARGQAGLRRRPAPGDRGPESAGRARFAIRSWSKIPTRPLAASAVVAGKARIARRFPSAS